MHPLSSDLDLLPLTTPALIEERVGSLIGRASRRQLWFLFLDEDSRQLPLLVPMDDYPVAPDRGDTARFAGFLSQVAMMADATAVIVVLERYSDQVLTTTDRAWVTTLAAAAAASELQLRGMLLSHSGGVAWLPEAAWATARGE